MPHPLDRLLDGFEAFRQRFILGEADRYAQLRLGQAPRVLIIACSDSRVDPAVLTGAEPGDLFIVRNVAAIVPAYDPDGRPKGTSSAIEFAVKGLGVSEIIVLGHGSCGGMRLLAEEAAAGPDSPGSFEFVSDWVRPFTPVCSMVAEMEIQESRRQVAIEQGAILTSLTNLLSFPWLRQRISEDAIALHGWYFDLQMGELLHYDPKIGSFVPTRGNALPIGAKELENPLTFTVTRLLKGFRRPDGSPTGT